MKLAELFVEITAKGFTDLMANFGALGSTMATLTGGIGMLGQSLGGFIDDAIGEAMDAEDAFARLQGAIRATGGVTGVAADEMEEIASTLQKFTRFSDEAVMGAQAILVSFTNIRGDVFRDATMAAADFAAATGKDMSSAAQTLGRALNDPIKGLTLLSRAGVHFSDAQKQMVKDLLAAGEVQKAQGVILDKFNEKYHGMAEVMGNTTAGAVTRLGNAFSDLMETIGGAFTPAIQLVSEHLQETIQWASESAGSLDDWGDAIANAANDALDFSEQLIVETFQAISEWVTANMETFTQWGQHLLDIGASVGEGLSKAFATLGEIISSIFGEVSLKSVMDFVTTALDYVNFFTRNASDLLAIFALDFAANFMKGFDAIVTIGDRIVGVFIAIWQGVQDTFAAMIEYIVGRIRNIPMEIMAAIDYGMEYASYKISGYTDEEAEQAASAAYNASMQAAAEGDWGPQYEEKETIESVGKKFAESFAANLSKETGGAGFFGEIPASESTKNILKSKEALEQDIANRELERLEKIKEKNEEVAEAAASDELDKELDETFEKFQKIFKEMADAKLPKAEEQPFDDFSKKDKAKKEKKEKDLAGQIVSSGDFAKKMQEALFKSHDKEQKKIVDNTARTATAVEEIAKKAVGVGNAVATFVNDNAF